MPDTEDESVASAPAAFTHFKEPAGDTFITLDGLYTEMCFKLGVDFGSPLSSRDVAKCLYEYTGEYTFAKPISKPVPLHCAYTKRKLTILIMNKSKGAFSKIDMKDPATYTDAGYLAMPKDADSGEETRPDKYMKIIFPDLTKELQLFLVALDRAICYWHVLDVVDGLYKDSPCAVPTKRQLEATWVKDMAKGDAPCRHFVHSYEALDINDVPTGITNYSVDVGVVNNSGRIARKNKKTGKTIALPKETKVKVFGLVDGEMTRIAEDHPARPYIVQQEDLEKGMKCIPAITFRGFNHLPEKESIGPSVKCDTLFAIERDMSSVDADMSAVIDE